MLEELERAPHVIFTTAYDEYALKAFEVNALDYLLKPVEPKRLADAMQKVQYEDKQRKLPAANLNRGPLTDLDQVFVKDGERCWFVKLGEIRLFESVGNYAKVFFANNKPLILKIAQCVGRTIGSEHVFSGQPQAYHQPALDRKNRALL